MFEDFDQDFEGMEDEIQSIQKNAKIQEQLAQIKDQLVRSNYDSLVNHGIDVETMKAMKINIQPIKETLQLMLKWFQDLEEYEKCAVIHSNLKAFE